MEGGKKVEDVRVTGMMIHYLYICHRKLWLLPRGVFFSGENYFLKMGKLIEEKFLYERSRENKELEDKDSKIYLNEGYLQGQIDYIDKEGNCLIVGEIKRSGRARKAALMQIAFYLYILKLKGIENIKGKLLLDEEKEEVEVILSDELEREVKKAIMQVKSICRQPHIPKAIPLEKHFCRGCSFKDFCFA